MKKILTLVLIILVVALFSVTSLAGCSNVSQLNKLEAPWQNYERFTYKLTETVDAVSTEIGTLVMTVTRLNNESATVNTESFDKVTGSYCTFELNIASGENTGDCIRSEVLFKTDFTPIASYKTTDLNGDVNTSYIEYFTSKNKSILTFNGEEKEFKQSATSYDNEMLYILVRASDVKDSKYTMSFSVTDNIEGGTRSIRVAQGSETKITVAPFGELNCRSFTLGATATYGDNASLSLLIASSPIIIGSGEAAVSVVKPIIKITEGAYSYTLTDISLTEE